MNLKELGIMTFPEASERWGRERSYVLQQYNKYPEKFLDGTVIKIGMGKGTQIISREGMEHLTGMTEEEANGELWLVRHEKDWIIDFEQVVKTEDKAKKLTALKVTEELQALDVPIKFEKVDNKEKYYLKTKNNSIYSYEKKLN